MYAHFVSYLGFCLTEEDQIHNGTTLHVANPILLIPCLLMLWWLKEPGHQHSAGMVLTPKAGIFRLQHQKSFYKLLHVYFSKFMSADETSQQDLQSFHCQTKPCITTYDWPRALMQMWCIAMYDWLRALVHLHCDVMIGTSAFETWSDALADLSSATSNVYRRKFHINIVQSNVMKSISIQRGSFKDSRHSVGEKPSWFIRHLSDGLYIFNINLWNMPWTPPLGRQCGFSFLEASSPVQKTPLNYQKSI